MNNEIKVFGKRLPFDSDSCFEWGLYCLITGNDPDTPVEMTREEFNKVLETPIQLPTNA